MATLSSSTKSQTPFPVHTGSHRGDRDPISPKPNAHPYAIKTTSSAILTRSNSTNTPVHTAHYYVPTSTSPSSKHRQTRSDTDATASSPSPRPLPVPPSPKSPTRVLKHSSMQFSADEIRAPLWRTKRAETLPTLPLPSPAIKLEDLPSNPKAWTASHLSSYLTTALRVKSGDSLPLPVPVARDIANFVKDARLDGRTFLRLTEADLEQLGINNLWRSALLNASRNLRQNVLQGQIWGFEDNTDSTENKSPYSNFYYNSSSSSVDLPGSLDTTPGKSVRGNRNGRVRGMVETFERSSSCSSRGSASESDHVREATVWVDEDIIDSDCEGIDEARGRMSERQVGEGNEESTFGSPVSTDSDRPLEPSTPITPDVEFILEIPSELDEPSMQELLTLSKSNSDSWGAKAWEDIDMTAGVTVKRIVDPTSDINRQQETVIGLGSGRKKNLFVNGMSIGRSAGMSLGRSAGKLDTKRNLGDIFSRPLPDPPAHPSEDDEVNALTVVAETAADEQRPDMKDTMVHVGDVEKEKEAESLLNDYKNRVLQLEDKLKEMETKEVERTRGYVSQSVQTEVTGRSESCQAVDTSDLDSEGSKVMDTEDPVTSVTTAKRVVNQGRSRPVVRGSWREAAAGEDKGWEPLEGGSLSSYVLMVGFGVCAIVVQTMLKRWASKRP